MAGTRSGSKKRKRKEGSAARTVGSVFSKVGVGRFAALHALRRRNVAKERGRKRDRATAGSVDAGATAQVYKPCVEGAYNY
ncbi:unnamed protein product [Miscanthus lutarioriparius]|uniref:Uncharacterized protein n=1 Tax=Miscanthus lutarioriparius TaxID=422564 RepID=A0A811N670_9POAL|nr:unnamed protein product [Miscanthus lutarioriparius]